MNPHVSKDYWIHNFDHPPDLRDDPATVAVYALIRDLSDRRGLKQAWWNIDADVRRELIQTWRKMIRYAYHGEPAKR